jgi:hypothetical protein
MNSEFLIVDGKLFIDKDLFKQSLATDNHLSKLTGNSCSAIFKTMPEIHTGIESIIIDYHNADHLIISQNLETFISDISSSYHSEVRGKITVSVDDQVFDVIINQY